MESTVAHVLSPQSNIRYKGKKNKPQKHTHGSKHLTVAKKESPFSNNTNKITFLKALKYLKDLSQFQV